MPDEGTTPEFTTWSAAGHAIRIHYRNELMNSISEAAWEGLQKVPRRGLEIGGVLYGECDGDEVRVLEWRPISCEHSNGPSFDLSERDRENLQQQLLDTEAAPQGLSVVGWFHTHTKDGVLLSDADVGLYNEYFPAKWQVALVLRPHLQEPPRAGFFFREENGSLQAERSHAEFELARRSRRLPVGFDPSNPQVRSPLRDGSPDMISPSAPVATPPPVRPWAERGQRRAPAPSFGTPNQEPTFEREDKKGHWKLWLAIAVPVLAILVAFGAPLVEAPDSDIVGLQARDTGGQLLVEWNHGATAVMAAESGMLRIVDGPDRQEIPLSREELRTGNITYLHRTGDVELQLDLITSGAETRSEITRFLGEAPAAPATSAADSGQRAVLEAEAELLQRQIADEQSRNKELQETINSMRGSAAAR